MLNIVVFISGGGTNLQALIDACACGEIKNGRIRAILSSRAGAYGLARAKQAGIESFTLPRKAYPSADDYCAALSALLRPLKPDLLVLAGFLCVLTPAFCDEYQHRILNVHPALIPAFCGDGFYGLRVHEQALQRGVKVTGATVHFVDAVTDGGPIVLQQAVPVLDGDTAETLQRRVMEQAEWQLLPQAVDLFCRGKLQLDGTRVTILP